MEFFIFFSLLGNKSNFQEFDVLEVLNEVKLLVKEILVSVLKLMLIYEWTFSLLIGTEVSLDFDVGAKQCCDITTLGC